MDQKLLYAKPLREVQIKALYLHHQSSTRGHPPMEPATPSQPIRFPTGSSARIRNTIT
ncbi:MAG TPA: hypothetical protein ACFCUD_15150 [Cyclobacteriaceae bacterium]